MEKYEKNFSFEEKKVADDIADEIIENDDSNNRSFIFLILFFLICLIFLVASLSFAIFNTYYNGGLDNVIDIGTDIVVKPDDQGDKVKPDDQGDKVKPDAKPNISNPDSNSNDENEDKNDNNEKPSIDSGTILFTYNESSNTIDMNNVFPMSDSYGKKLNGNNEYFDFNVSSTFSKIKTGKIVYEISLVPKSGNTINEDDIRVYLTEDGNEVSINENMVNDFSDLPNSTRRTNGKLIYKKTVTQTEIKNYTFRMWYSYDAPVPMEEKSFGCFVVIDAYYEK